MLVLWDKLIYDSVEGLVCAWSAEKLIIVFQSRDCNHKSGAVSLGYDGRLTAIKKNRIQVRGIISTRRFTVTGIQGTS